MGTFARLGSLRFIITTLTTISAAQIGLVAFDNLIDYHTNYAFVQHVLAMDTTFRSPLVMWRAITNPTVVTSGYLLIIAWESLTAIILVAAVGAWLWDSDGARTLSSLIIHLPDAAVAQTDQPPGKL